MRREVEVLRAVRHPGVVELVAVEEGPEGPTMLTAPADAPSLARLANLSLEEVAGVVAAVASTLADLHDLGIVHGGLTAEQVLVAADGRPVLRGFAHGGRIGEPRVTEAAPPPEVADPGRVGGDALDPAADVYAVGVLLRRLVDAAADGRAERGRRGSADALRSLAGRATAGDPRLRLSARALADAVRHAVPGARLPRRSTLEPPTAATAHPRPLHAGPRLRRPAVTASDGRRRDPAGDGRHAGGAEAAGRWQTLDPSRRRRWALAGAAVVCVTVVVGLALLRTAPPRSEPAPPATTKPPITSETRPVRTTSPTPSTVVTAPAPGCPEVDSVLLADVDGDGCAEALRWADGVVEAGGERWSVGGPGDLVATGDWACRGRSTLALLRPATGDVFVFDGWAGPGQELAAAAQTRVEGAFALRAADLDRDGCAELLVERAGGPPVRGPRP